ncbi:glycosyltransferase family 1 protein [Naasia lichenicola]|uniref:D-inositol 3-phosphate glycosyltransferase n=2 Tax=Naasia lichenicola TaxID=2565933 RepID=A0A4S4FU91_9MICO|nr:glycosyltransferase family 1 protein [Naasia lichenicola]
MNGVTTSVRQALKHLRAQGHEAIVVCPKPAPKSFAGFEVVTTNSIPFQGFNLGVPGPRRVPNALERFAPDVVHVASPAWTIGRTALLGARQLGVPSIAVYQTDIPRYSRRFRNRLITQRAEQMMAELHNLATRNLVPSSSARADLIRFGVAERSLHQWGRGVDTIRFSPDRRDSDKVARLRESVLRGRRGPIVGYVGRLALEKQVERLDALTGLGASLVIVGDGPMRSTLEALLPADTAFLGELRGNRLADAYAALDIFVHTGTQETFGQTLQEAMATGIPVVAPAAGGPLDIVADGVTGFLYDPLDDAELTAVVAGLIEEPDLAREMGDRGRIAVEGRSWAAICDELIGHYRHAMAEVLQPA